MDQEKSQTYTKDEIVWAKIRGYPWWPAIVSKVTQDNADDVMKYQVNFIGDNSYSSLPGCYLAKYQDKYDEVVPKIRKKGLKDSVMIADSIRKGQTTYESEVKKLQQKKLQTKLVTKSRQMKEESSDLKKRNKRRFSSSSEEFSQNMYQSSRKSKNELIDESDKKPMISPQNEIADLLKLLNETKLNVTTVENKIQIIQSLLVKSKPDIVELLQGNGAKSLIQIQEQLVNKQKNGGRNLVQVINLVGQLVDRMKSELLKLYFDPTEIIEQLHHVSGQKKVTQKLLEKLSNEQDWILKDTDEEEDSESESEEQSSQLINKRTKIKHQQVKPEKQRPALSMRKSQQEIGIRKQNKRTQKQTTQFDSPLGIANIANPNLRKKVCHKLLETIQSQFGGNDGKVLSVQIENKLRESDPEMGNKYKSGFFQIVENLKIKQTELQNMQQNNHFEKLWSIYCSNIANTMVSLLKSNEDQVDELE